MIPKIKFFLVPLIVIFCHHIYSQKYPTVQLPTTIVREIKSSSVKDRVYELYIDLPPSYITSDQKYPVVYLLDAYETFGLMLQTYQQLLVMHEIPELIIVGISYPIEGDFYSEGLREYHDIRAGDFTPTHLTYDEVVKRHGQATANWIRFSGGATDFLEFFEAELIPFIKSEYRTDPAQRGLFGYSLGATFTTFALLNKPGLFKKYFIGSPMLSWDNYSVYNFDNTDDLSGSLDIVDVYISWGQLESNDGKHHPLKDTLANKNNPHIHFISEVLESETHLSGIGLAYSRAFRRLYGGK
jgi:predicted alpha/beta superfamily hydrolase